MTAAVVVAAVPIFARLLAWFGPRSVVSTGFLASAAGHLIEWQQSSGRPWVAVVIYLHVAGLGALLLSGYWTIVSERFDPRGARESFGRIAAAGTFGGALGGLAADRLAMGMSPNSVLLMLAGLHVLCAAGTLVLGRAPVLWPVTDAAPSERVFAFQVLKTSPHLRTIAMMVLLTTAGAGVLDFLLKWHVTQALGTGPYGQQCFLAGDGVEEFQFLIRHDQGCPCEARCFGDGESARDLHGRARESRQRPRNLACSSAAYSTILKSWPGGGFLFGYIALMSSRVSFLNRSSGMSAA